MKITRLTLAVLREIEEHDDCGVNALVCVIFPNSRHQRMQLRAGQYMGKLVNRGLVRKRYHEYRGKRGQMLPCGVSYHLTGIAREILKSEK